MEAQEELRPYLFAIAYRMLGSVTEAEDVVQEAFLRYHAADAEREATSPKAYLATVTTRLAIDELRSARARREVYPGEWLPEPLVEDDTRAPRRRHSWAPSARRRHSSAGAGKRGGTASGTARRS
jgi:RNA polymerase sigma factor (sigma-70 family)